MKNDSIQAKEGLALFLGKSSNEIIKKYGEPTRVDLSSYGYDWWIYNNDDDEYLQVAVEDHKIVSIYAIGSKLNVAPFSIGQEVDQLFQFFNLDTTIDISWEGNSYRFELSEEDLGVRPLVKLEDVYAQVYIDRFTNRISSVRFLTDEQLIKQRPFELIYRGELPEEQHLSDEQWTQVETGDEKQIFEITNIIRKRFNLQPVERDDLVAEVALSHSQDMFQENYFSHVSPLNGDLKDRLTKGKVKFTVAGENIAAKYVDGIAALEGWLNSKGHRETLLSEEFTHLGVGVYHKYYTQNFIKVK